MVAVWLPPLTRESGGSSVRSCNTFSICAAQETELGSERVSVHNVLRKKLEGPWGEGGRDARPQEGGTRRPEPGPGEPPRGPPGEPTRGRPHTPREGGGGTGFLKAIILDVMKVIGAQKTGPINQDIIIDGSRG